MIRFGSAGSPTAAAAPGPESVWRAIPFAVKAVLLEILLAVIAFALVRARRLGRPMQEQPISPIPAGELVQAASRLYRKSRATSFSGALLRAGARDALRRRLGLPPGSSTADIAETAGRLTARPTADVRGLLADGSLRNDDELISLGLDLEDLRQAVEAATR